MRTRADRSRWIAALALLLCVPAAPALGPHEILVLANRASPRSVEIAREFMRLRQVPAPNLLLLDLPEALFRTSLSVSPREFTTRIWDPAQIYVRTHGLADHVLAWVYSVDFPIRVTTAPPLSITGLTFLRNRLPDLRTVDNGSYLSLLYAGPETIGQAAFGAQSFDVQRAWLGADMPLPAMMLGFAGERGNSVAEILACLRRGVAADGTFPRGTVYFVLSDDIRSLCRQWQFPPAVEELRRVGIHGVITNAPPRGDPSILGIMLGTAVVDTAGLGAFVPGAVAEHLTSLAAYFDIEGQTKLSAWIRAGATASAGTVAEPRSIWSKFPHARVFAHSAAGCTLIEALYQSYRCPLQALIVGEPLAAPWQPRAEVRLEGLPAQAAGPMTVSATVTAPPGDVYVRFTFLLDGRPVPGDAGTPRITVNAADLEPGPHTLRAVALRAGPVRTQAFGEQTFLVKEGGRR